MLGGESGGIGYEVMAVLIIAAYKLEYVNDMLLGHGFRLRQGAKAARNLVATASDRSSLSTSRICRMAVGVKYVVLSTTH